MALEDMRKGYRDRLTTGQIVYLAEGPDLYDRDSGTPMVKKASVIEDCQDRRYAVIRRWEDTDVEPGPPCIDSTYSPRCLFTEEEVDRVIRNREGFTHLAGMSIDALIKDKTLNTDLAVALSSTVISRIAEDLGRVSPEY